MLLKWTRGKKGGWIIRAGCVLQQISPPAFLHILNSVLPAALCAGLALWLEVFSQSYSLSLLSVPSTERSSLVFLTKIAPCRVFKGFGGWSMKKMWPQGTSNTHKLYLGAALTSLRVRKSLTARLSSGYGAGVTVQKGRKVRWEWDQKGVYVSRWCRSAAQQGV